MNVNDGDVEDLKEFKDYMKRECVKQCQHPGVYDNDSIRVARDKGQCRELCREVDLLLDFVIFYATDEI